MQETSSATYAPRFPVARQMLMIDADDTLWENNIYFERAIDSFVALVADTERSPAELREAFDRFEAGRVAVHGYGTDAFHQSLLAGFEHLTGAACDEQQTSHVANCAMQVRRGELMLLAGVADTLERLAQVHTLMLVTKGDHTEQTDKLQRSGLGSYFQHVEVLHEKHEDAYRKLLLQYRLDSAATWMIGNSPRSDVNPALAAGMHAVYLPHPSTWVLEQEPLAVPLPGRSLLQLNRFGELLSYFA